MLFVTTDASMWPKALPRNGLIVLPRLVKRSQEEFAFQEAGHRQGLVLLPLTIGDFLRAWRVLKKGDDIVAIHAYTRFEQTALQAKAAARLLRPGVGAAVFEALSHHSVRQIVDVLLHYRHVLTVESAAMIVRQIQIETASWILLPRDAARGPWWRRLLTRFHDLEWRTLDYQTGVDHVVPGSDLLSNMYQQTASGSVNVFVTGYPSAAPAGKVISEIKEWPHVRFMEITQLQVRYPHIPTLAIIEFLPSRERVEAIVRNAPGVHLG